MKDKVYPSKEVAPFHDSFVWAYLNVDLAATRKVMKYFPIRGVPYIVMISPEGEVLESSTGLIKSDKMVSMTTSALKKSGVSPTRPTATTTKPEKSIFKSKQ